MNEKEAVKMLKRIDIKFFLSAMSEQSNYIVDEADKVNKAIETVLNLIEKQNKIIDLMAEELYIAIRDLTQEGWGNVFTDLNKQQIIEYFRKETEKNA